MMRKKLIILLSLLFVTFMMPILTVSSVDILDLLEYWHACLEMVDGEGHRYKTLGPYNLTGYTHIRVSIDDTIPDGKKVRVTIYQYLGSTYYDDYVYEESSTGWVYLGDSKINILVRIEHAEDIWQYDVYGHNEALYYL